MPIYQFEGKIPKIHPTVFVAPTASIIGEVVVGEGSSVWPGAVIRGDSHNITIGKYTSIQDNAVLHEYVKIGDHTLVGHGAVVHSATIENNNIIGIRAIVLDGTKIHKNSIIGTRSVVLENTEIPANSLALGIPAKVVRTLNASEQEKSVQMITMTISSLAKKYKEYMLRESL